MRSGALSVETVATRLNHEGHDGTKSTKYCQETLFVTFVAFVRSSPDDERKGRRGKVDDADVTVQIERPLHLRKVALAHERLLVGEKARHDRNAAEIQRRKIARRATARPWPRPSLTCIMRDS